MQAPALMIHFFPPFSVSGGCCCFNTQRNEHVEGVSTVLHCSAVRGELRIRFLGNY